MIACTRGQMEGALCRVSVKVPSGVLVSHQGIAGAASTYELAAKLIVTGIVLVIGACILIPMWFDTYRIQETIKMCGRGDHEMCTVMSPWCPRRGRTKP